MFARSVYSASKYCVFLAKQLGVFAVISLRSCHAQVRKNNITRLALVSVVTWLGRLGAFTNSSGHAWPNQAVCGALEWSIVPRFSMLNDSWILKTGGRMSPFWRRIRFSRAFGITWQLVSVRKQWTCLGSLCGTPQKHKCCMISTGIVLTIWWTVPRFSFGPVFPSTTSRQDLPFSYCISTAKSCKPSSRVVLWIPTGTFYQ